MQVWMANTRGALVQDHELFTLIYKTLHARRAPGSLEQFPNLREVADLPWLDQPRLIEPTDLTLELYAAWEALWMLELPELAVSPGRCNEVSAIVERSCYSMPKGTFGRYFAAPMHRLAAFAASTNKRGRLRVATHRSLALGSATISELRLIQGGRSTSASGARAKV